MTLTQYFIGAWVTAVGTSLLMVMALADGDLRKKYGSSAVTSIAFAIVIVTAATWPLSLLVYCGAMIRSAELR